jgi:hypothetical protein
MVQQQQNIMTTVTVGERQQQRKRLMTAGVKHVRASSSAITTVSHLRRSEGMRTTYGLSDADRQALEAKDASFRARAHTLSLSNDATSDSCCRCWRMLPVIYPESKLRLRWDAIQAVALLYVALMVPIRTGFFADPTVLSAGWWIELAVDIYFIADIVINFRTGYHSHDSEMVLSLSQIAKHYGAAAPVAFSPLPPYGCTKLLIGGAVTHLPACAVPRVMYISKTVASYRCTVVHPHHVHPVCHAIGSGWALRKRSQNTAPQPVGKATTAAAANCAAAALRRSYARSIWNA